MERRSQVIVDPVDRGDTRVARFMRAYGPAGLAVLFGAAVRLACIGWGLPQHPDPDEGTISKVSLKLLTTELHPHYFTHPSLALYLYSFLFVAYFAVGRVLGRFRDDLDFVAEYSIEPTVFYLLIRSAALIAGIGTMVVWYAVARRLLSRRSAVFVVLLLSSSPLLIAFSVNGKTYSIALLLMSLGVLFSLRHLQEGSRRTLWLSAVFTGLAVSSNYATGFSAVCPALAVILRRAAERRWAEAAGDLAVVAAAGMAAFFAASPYVLLDFPEFYEGFATQAAFHVGLARAESVAPTASLWRPFHLYYFRFLANEELMIPALVAAALGLVVLARRSWKVAAVLCFVPLISLIYFSSGVFVVARGMFFTVPFLLFFAVAASDPLAGRRALHWAAMLALVTLPGMKAAEQVARCRRVDNYTLAASWISQNIPADARVLQDAGQPRLFPSDAQIDREMVEGGVGAEGTARLRREAVKRYFAMRPELRRFDVRRLEYDRGPSENTAAYQVSLEDIDAIVLSGGRMGTVMAAAPGIAEAGKRFYARIEREWDLVKVFPAEPEVRLGGTVRVYLRRSAKKP